MMIPRLFITQRLPEAAAEWLAQSKLDVDVYSENKPIPRDILLQKIKDAEGLISMLSDTIDAGAIAAAPRLKVIANYAVGTNNIDLDAAKARGIIVCNTPGVLTNATAELTWALILAVARRIPESEAFVRNGNFIGWQPTLLNGHDISGKTLGIIGAGRIGERAAQIGQGFGMHILYTRRTSQPLEHVPHARQVSMNDLLPQADIISVHTPLTEETRHLITLNEFKMMKSSVIFINTSRGPVVKEDDLVQALGNGIIAGAGLDVYEREPLIHPGLLKLKNVVLLPHTGSATTAARNRMAQMVIEDTAAVLNNQPPKFRVI